MLVNKKNLPFLINIGVLLSSGLVGGGQVAHQQHFHLNPKKAAAPVVRRLRVKKEAKEQGAIPLPDVIKGEEGASFVLALPEYGDMDVPGKKLLDGAAFCVGQLRAQLSKGAVKFSYGGSSTKVGDAGVEQLLKFPSEVRIVIGATGSEYLLQLLSHPQLKKMFYLFPIDGSTMVREKASANTIFFRPTYKQELRALVNYLMEKHLETKVAILYESGLWGSALYEELCQLLKEKNITPLIAARYQKNTVDVGRAIKAIGNAAPSAVLCLAKPRPAYKFVKDAVDFGMHSTVFLGLSPLLSIQHLLKNARGVDLVAISVVPPETASLELVDHYKKFFGERFTFKRSNPYYLEAFLYSQLLLNGLQAVPEAAKQPELLLKYFESFKDKNFLGLPLSFNPSTRGLVTRLWIVPGNDKQWIEVAL